MPNSKIFNQALTEWVHVFMRRSMQAFTRWMNEVGLSRTQIGALMRIYNQGHCPVTSIGNELGITTPAASQLVDRLVQMDLLERSEDLEDRRVKVVTLTEAGKELIQEGFMAKNEWINDLTATFSDDEQLALAASLNTMVEAANQLGEDPELIPELFGHRM
ncbi:MAG: MarR family transcriptional regulator [Chloroflexi bacterium]|nr:MarR family transcriptional regulator [Chloroflexota bacterium]